MSVVDILSGFCGFARFSVPCMLYLAPMRDHRPTLKTAAVAALLAALLAAQMSTAQPSAFKALDPGERRVARMLSLDGTA